MKEEYKGTTKLYSRCTEVEAVVLANGEYPTASLPLHILESAPYVVCCDGGADEYIRQGHIPNLIIGDGDSICEENRRKYGHLLHCISEQETNDQTKAVSYLLSQGKRRIAIVGATGRREDHTLGISACLWTTCVPEPMYVLIQTMAFSSLAGTRVPSLPAGAAGIYHQLRRRRLHGIGLVYPLSDFTNWWQGTLNECTGTELQSKLKENTYCS